MVVSFSLFFFFRLSLVLLPFAFLRSGAKRTLYDLFCPCFPPELMVKLTRKTRRHSVTLIVIGMQLIENNPRHISKASVTASSFCFVYPPH